MPWLQLIRWKNLAIVMLTQLFVWYFLIRDSASYEGGTIFLRLSEFTLLSLSTILITAAGYIINDYFDIKIDAINRPSKVVLADKIPLRSALIAHAALNIMALVLCGVVAVQARHLLWPLMQFFCIVLLWFYSTHFKRQVLSGNIVVALLTSFTILVLVLYEPYMHHFLHKPVRIFFYREDYYINPLWVSMAYCFFAFMLTLMREIVKDMEDHTGDAAEGCRTLPVKMGLRFSAGLVRVLCAGTIAALLVMCRFMYSVKAFILGVYVILLIIVPLMVWFFYLTQRDTPAHYHSASRWLKVIMLAGICSLIIYHLEVQNITCTE